MSILNNLKKMHAAIVVDRVKNENNPKIGPRLNILAVKALTGGIKSDDWKFYMAIFADNAAQLRRLTVAEDGEPAYLQQSRAYIVSNAICDVGTNGQTAQNVDGKIDDGLTVAADTEPVQFRPEDFKKIPEVNEI